MEGDQQRQEHQCGTDHNTDDIHLREFSAGIPGSLCPLAEAPQLHGIGDGFNPLHGGKDQGDQNGAGCLQPVNQACFLAHFRTTGLLGQGNIPVFSLNFWNVP